MEPEELESWRQIPPFKPTPCEQEILERCVDYEQFREEIDELKAEVKALREEVGALRQAHHIGGSEL